MAGGVVAQGNLGISSGYSGGASRRGEPWRVTWEGSSGVVRRVNLEVARMCVIELA